MMVTENKRIEKILYIIAIFMLGLMLVLCFNESIWTDEMFDFRMIQNDYSYFLLTNRDASPPLHFAILKFGVDLCAVLFPNFSRIMVAKIISVIPYIILVVLAHTKIRRLFGGLSSAFFAFTITTMPHMLHTAIEVRQYSWAILFTTVCFVYSYEAIVSNKMSLIITSIVFGVVAVATHYYAAFAIAFCYIIFLYFFFKNKNFEKLRKVFLVIIGSCVLFSPWLIMAGKEIVAMAEGFWIPVITWNDVPGFLTYALATDTNKANIGYVVTAVFYIIIAYLIVKIIKSNIIQMEKCFIIVGIAIPVFVLGVGVIIGLFIWPVFQVRYILPVLGCLWLGFSVAVAKGVNNKKIFFLIIVFLLGVASLNTYKNVKDEMIYNKNIKNLQAFFDTLEQEDILIVNNRRYDYIFEMYTNQETLLWDEGTDENVEQIKVWLSEGREVFYFDGPVEGEVVDIDLLKKCESAGLKYGNKGEYGLEYVFSTLYQIIN